MKKGSTKKNAGPLLALAILLILAGLGVYLYPTVSNAVYEHKVEASMREFELRFSPRSVPTASEPEGEAPEPEGDPLLEELYQELVARNEQLYAERQSRLVDPFSYEQPSIDLSQYGLADNTIGYLSIPKMEVVLPILLGANNYNMSLGAVHLTETSYPVGGENTNCVIAAHRGARSQDMFRNIQLLEIGDEITVENFRETLTYRVVELRVIKPTDIDQLLIQPGRDLITLVTCHPYGQNYQRYVVFCERVN